MQNIQKLYGTKQCELKQLSNQKLLSQTKALVQKERHIHIEVLHHLREIESRKLYFSQGFSSLFDYAVQELGYSEGAAYRRIKAMRLCRDIPETEARLQSGRLSLSSACQLQNFFEKQAKKVKQKNGAMKQENNIFQKEKMKNSRKVGSFGVVQQAGDSENNRSQNFLKDSLVPSVVLEEERPVKSLSFEEKQDLLKRAEGRSTRETERLLSEADPSLSVPREQARFLGKDKVEIKAVIDKDCYRKIEELKNLLSHRNPSLSYGKLFMILVDEGLKRHDPCRKGSERQSVKTGNAPVSATSAQKYGQSGNVLVTSAPKLGRNRGVSITSAPKYGKTDDKVTGGVNSESRKSTVLADGKPGTTNRYHGKLVRRGVPAQIKRDIWRRDQGRCAYVHPGTGKRCGSRYLLQIDHIRPFSLGGGSERENLRLLCAGHNRFRSGSVRGTLP